MATEEKVEKVGRLESKEKVGQATPVEAVERVAPNPEEFERLMAEERGMPLKNETSEQELQRASLIEEMREVSGRLDKLERKKPAEIVDQTREMIAQIDDIKGRLQSNQLRIDPSTEQLMHKKLEHIDDKLKLTLQMVGSEYTPLETRQARSSLRNPIERFLGFLENGESQLHEVGARVAELGNNRKTIDPAQLLAIQIKVGFIQNELDFFTSLLNKALESTKTVMNVQV